MEWLNYQHLLYFWTVVRAGTVLAASEQLRLSPSTISEQLHTLEENLGEKLLRRSGRNLVPTDTGVMVFRYADEIFATGRELLDTLKGRPTGRPMRLVIGIADVVPKTIVRQLIEPALTRLLRFAQRPFARRNSPKAGQALLNGNTARHSRVS